jgi:putative SOS response-associated peptidase YedK
MRLLAPAEAPEWEAHPVATFVNSPRNDGPELMARIAKPPSQFLF